MSKFKKLPNKKKKNGKETSLGNWLKTIKDKMMRAKQAKRKKIDWDAHGRKL